MIPNYKIQTQQLLEQIGALNDKINIFKKYQKKGQNRVNTVGNSDLSTKKLLAFDPEKVNFKNYSQFKKMADMGVFRFLSPSFSGFTLPQAARLTRNSNIKTGRRELGSLMFELFDKLSVVRGTPHKSRRSGEKIDNEWGARQIIIALQSITSPFVLEKKLNAMARNVSYNYESNLVALYYQVFKEN